MHKCIFIMVLLFAITANAQTKTAPGTKTQPTVKGPAGKAGKANAAKQDSLKKDSLAKVVEAPVKLPREFLVYTKKAKSKGERTKLCINLVSKDTVLNYCMNDSICKDPEFAKILFEERKGDTLYVLVFIEAYTKIEGNDDGRCSAGRETKLVFARWNTKTNQAKWKQKNIESCIKGITNMTKDAIDSWDKASALMVNYHRGLNFYEIKFDPQQYQLGIQSSNNTDSEGK